MVTIAVFPAFALTSQEKEELYQAAVLQLEAYLDSFGNSSEELTGTINTFKELGGYSQSLNLGYYASVLAKIADEQYDFIMKTYLDMLESDTDFNAYLLDALKDSSIGTADKLKAYAQAREFQHNGEKTTAAEYYKQCGSFFDAKVRYIDLIGDTYQTQYDHAFSLLNEGNYAGAYFAFSAISSYNDSAAIMASIVNQLGYTPETPNDNLRPVSGLDVYYATTSQIRIYWTNSFHATSYEVYYKQHDTNEWIFGGLVSNGKNSIEIDNLKEATEYDFKVISAIGMVKSTDSDIATWTTDSTTYTYGDYEYKIFDNEITITHYSGTAKNLTIPEIIDGKTVRCIGNKAFSDHDALQKVVFPDTLIRIGENPFEGCRRVKEFIVSANHPILKVINGGLVYKPDNRLICYAIGINSTSYKIPDGIEIIGESAFACSENLRSIFLPDSVKSIEKFAFNCVFHLQRINIPNGVIKVGINIFNACRELEEVQLSSNHPVLELRNGTLVYKPDKKIVSFPGCNPPETYTIPDYTTSIGSWAFANSDNLKNLIIPGNITSIGDTSFCYCTELKAVSIQEGVSTIDAYAFSQNSNLLSVTIPKSVIAIGPGAFDIYNKNLTIIVSPNSYALQYCKDNSLNYRIE